MIKQNQRYLNIVLINIDAFIVALSLLLAYFIRFQSGILPIDSTYLPFIEYMEPLLYIIPLYIGIGYFFDLYKPQRSNSLLREFVNIGKTSLLCVGLFLSVLFITKNIHYSRKVIALFGIISTLLFGLERLSLRYFLRSIRKKGHNQKHIIIVGYSRCTEEYIRQIKNNPQWGYNILGILDNHKKKNYTYSGINVIGTLDDLDEIVDNKILDEIVISLKIDDYQLLEKLIYKCEKSGVFTKIIPDYFKFITRNPHIEDVNGLPVISIREVPLHNIMKKLLKRTIDIVGSFIALVLFSPVMLFVILGLKLTSPGPILFKQERVGLNKKNFNMLKFRSMKVQETKDSDTVWTTSNDPRITPLGSFIRRASIDELPQLFNVLKGDMSLIGPRPERPFYVDKFKEEIPKYMIKHQVRPGMTGWAQVNGWRGDTSIKKRIEYDIYYIENWTLKMDVKIVFMTIFKGFVHRNAY